MDQEVIAFYLIVIRMQKIVFWLLVVLCSIGGLLARKWRNARMVLIDNPTGHTIAFTLDNKEYSLLPFRQMTISLINGEHTLIMDDEVNTFYKSGFNFPKSFNELVDTLHFITPIEILNPTRSPYVVGHQIYTDGTLSEETMRALRPKYTCPSGKNR